MIATQHQDYEKGLEQVGFWTRAFFNGLNWCVFVWWWCWEVWMMNKHSPTLPLWFIKASKSAYFTFGSNCSHVCPRILLRRNIPILHFNLCTKRGATSLWDNKVTLTQVCHLFWVCLYTFTTLRLCFWFYIGFVWSFENNLMNLGWRPFAIRLWFILCWIPLTAFHQHWWPNIGCQLS